MPSVFTVGNGSLPGMASVRAGWGPPLRVESEGLINSEACPREAVNEWTCRGGPSGPSKARPDAKSLQSIIPDDIGGYPKGMLSPLRRW